MRGKWVLIAGGLVFAALAVGTLVMLRHRPAPEPKRAVAPTAEAVTEANLSGTLRAQHVVDVEAEVIGIIDSFAVDVGEEVYQGQLLAHISSEGLQAEQERAMAAADGARAKLNSLGAALGAARLEASRARADANRARRESERIQRVYERQQTLVREGATPRLIFERAQKENDNARAEFSSLDTIARQAEDRTGELVKEIEISQRILNEKTREVDDAQLVLAAAEVHSPVDGLVVARQGEVGKTIPLDRKTLFRIAVDTNLLEAVLDPEPPQLPRFHPGQPALILAADVPDEGIPGEVKAVEKDQVVVAFASPTPLLRPGMQVQVRVKLIP